MQALGGVGGFDWKAFGEEDGAGVEARFHLHDGDAGFCISGHDDAVDGGRAAPAGQE